MIPSEGAVRANERFLRKIVGQRRIAPAEMTKEIAHRGLMAADEFAKRSVIIAYENPCDEIGIRVGHNWAENRLSFRLSARTRGR